MKFKYLIPVALLLLVDLAGAANAAANDCYEQARIPVDKRVQRSHTIVLLDETTVFDQNQRQHIVERLMPILAEGSTTEIIAFSAFSQGRYADPKISIKLAAPLDEATRMDIRKNNLKDFDVCLLISGKRARTKLAEVLGQYFNDSSSELARSDILGVLKEIGDNVMPRMLVKDKRIVLVSDMLENSDVSSFYAKGMPREIKPADELARAKAKGMLSDLRHAKIWVIGAGIVPTDGKKGAQSYRSGAVMASLKDFWSRYFEESNGKLMGFGQPLLLSPIDMALPER